MPYCLVVGCHTGQKKPGIQQYQLFYLPEDKGQRTKWLNVINRDFVPTAHSRICAKHFEDSDFIPDDENLTLKGTKKKYKTLKPNATPSLFLKDPKAVLERSTKNSASQKIEIAANSTNIIEQELMDFEKTAEHDILENNDKNRNEPKEPTAMDMPELESENNKQSEMINHDHMCLLVPPQEPKRKVKICHLFSKRLHSTLNQL